MATNSCSSQHGVPDCQALSILQQERKVCTENGSSSAGILTNEPLSAVNALRHSPTGAAVCCLFEISRKVAAYEPLRPLGRGRFGGSFYTRKATVT